MHHLWATFLAPPLWQKYTYSERYLHCGFTLKNLPKTENYKQNSLLDWGPCSNWDRIDAHNQAETCTICEPLILQILSKALWAKKNFCFLIFWGFVLIGLILRWQCTDNIHTTKWHMVFRGIVGQVFLLFIYVIFPIFRKPRLRESGRDALALSMHV